MSDLATVPRVLVVDDDPVMGAMLSADLGARGHVVDICATVSEAMDWCAPGAADVVLVDLHLADGAGIDVVRALRSADARVCIIMMTARPSDETLAQAVDAGADDYLVKPFPIGGEYSPLEFAIRRAVAHRRLTCEHEELLARLAKLNAALSRDLELAGRVQTALLQRPFAHPRVEAACTVEQSSHVGGDLYEVATTPDGAVFLAIGDVTGHGPGAAVVMALLYGLMQRLVVGARDPADALDTLSSSLCDLFSASDGGMFATVCLGYLDPADGTLDMASAGHPPPVSVTSEGKVTIHHHPAMVGIPCGILPTCGAQSLSLALEPGETLVLFTDGVTEARNPDGRLFGIEGVAGALRQAHRNGEPIGPGLMRDAVARFRRGAPPQDDALVLSIRYTP